MPSYADQRDERRAAYDAQRQLRRYLGSLTPQARRQYLADQQDVLQGDDDQQPARPEEPQPVRQPSQPGVSMYGFGPFASAVGAYGAYLGNHLQGAANDVMQAIQNENESRVAQNREMRRMEHESGMMQQRMELERMRLENERYRDQMDAANEIRKLKAAMAMQEGAGPRAWRMDRRSGQMMPSPVAGGGGRTRRRSYQQDPLTGQYRWMEDWEM